MVTKWLRRNREIHLPLTKRSSRRDYENIRRHLLSRFVSCPALPSNFCNRLLCSNFFTVRKRKVGPKIRLPTHTRTSRLRNRPLGAPLTFHRLDPRPEIRTINPNCISGPRAPFSYFFFFSYGRIYICLRLTDAWIVFRMSTKPHSQKRQSEQERGGVGVRVPRGIRILPSSA